MSNLMGNACFRQFLPILTCFAWAFPAHAVDGNSGMTLIRAADTAAEMRVVFANEAMLHKVERGGAPAWTIDRDKDPYQKVEWQVRFTEAFPAQGERLILRIDFYDEGAGVIQPRLLANDSFEGTWAEPSRQVSYTRLNTGRERSAYFEFPIKPLDWLKTANVHLRVAGLQFLRSIPAYESLSETQWQEAADSVPVTVSPIVQLKRPFELTCTVGIPDVGNPPSLQTALDNIREYAPLAKLLGFNSIECFVRWDLLEPRPGEFDFTHYDTLVKAIRRYDLKWYPLLVVTSGYSLPVWYFESAENTGLVCLEHGESCHVPSIWNPANEKHVVRVLQAFAKHYEPSGILEAVRLGPSGNFGEAQFPAGAGSALGHQGEPMHAHIGWWAGDSLAAEDFRRFISNRYQTVDALNTAWDTAFGSFDAVAPQLPETYRTPRGRYDMTEWYTGSMTRWCGFWAKAAREALPHTRIYQSSGGWGFREAGTDFSAQASSMRTIQGGIRLTNETDSFEQNVYATRLAATAARHYEIGLGSEPAGFHSARGVVARFFSCAATNATNLYTRHSVLFTHPYSVEKWLENIAILDQRASPIVDVAIYYPESASQLDDGAFRHLYGWGFNPRAAEVRRRIDVDYLDERLIRDGFLNRYAALVFCWGNVIPEDVLQRIDEWIRAGGTAIFPSFPRGDYVTLGKDASIFRAWARGDTGKGSMHRFVGDMEPLTRYGDFVESTLKEVPGLHPWTRKVLSIEHPPQVFFSVLQDGTLLTLNYGDLPAPIQQEGKTIATLAPYAIGVQRMD
ncbi:MAG: family 14 glycosylhydrolase [Candidatus Hydrogenedentes bacterium]|nr:family 14 glycosylhydrolase [Candidatus Hydrogenedentota bacterium]